MRARVSARWLPGIGAWPAGRRELVLGSVAVAGAVVALAVPLRAGTLVHPRGFALLTAWSVLGFVLAGLLWWRVRPWSRMGPLLCAIGLLFVAASFQGSGAALPFAVGVLADAPMTLLAWYVIAAFPSGRLTAWARALMAFALAVMAVGFLPWLLLSTTINGGTPLARCAACPASSVRVASADSLALRAGEVEEWGLLVFALLLVVTISLRFRRASRPRRRVLLPVYLAVGSWVIAFWTFHALLRTDASTATLDRFGVAVTVTRSLYPLGFVAAIVLARAYAGRAMLTMVGELSTEPTTRRLESIVRRVLDDPRARVAFWLPGQSRYVDAAAQPIELPAAGSGVSHRVFRRAGGEPVVAIVHDPVLDEDPELVEATGAATVLVVENRRLGETLRDSVRELRASQQRLSAAVAAERRRMERDLHDGSQARLLAIGLRLEEARMQAAADPEALERLTGLSEDVGAALDDLRAVAHGIYPAVLADLGLTAALRQAARRAGVPVAVDLETVPRSADELEAAVYYTCVEALQNVVKHAGPGASAKVTLRLEEGCLRFSVADDGVGFAEPAPGGSGLVNMADRVRAVGGDLTLDSTPGRGTVVAGSVPVDGRPAA